jgi:hypothetical protein
VLGARHAAERSLRCWGAGAGLSFDATRTAIRNLLEVQIAPSTEHNGVLSAQAHPENRPHASVSAEAREHDCIKCGRLLHCA